MFTIFLTGGLASGKTAVTRYLHEKGATIIDLDQMAKDIQETESVQAELKRAFGADIVDGEGHLKRSLLAERAFSSPEKTQLLNEICWPPVIEQLSELLVGGSCQPLQTGTMLVVEIPMLYEAPDLIDLADEVLVVEAPEELRLARAVARGMDPQDAASRLQAQVSDAKRRSIATTVIDNSGSIENLHQQLDDWYQQQMARLF